MSFSNATKLVLVLTILLFSWIQKNNAQPKLQNTGEPIPGAEIYVELEPDDEPICNPGAPGQPDQPFQTITTNSDQSIITVTYGATPTFASTHSITLKLVLDLKKILKIQPDECEVDGFIMLLYNNENIKKPMHYSCNVQSSNVEVVQLLPTIPQKVIIKAQRLGIGKKDIAPVKTNKETK
ncbi:MAG: hypothetical protein Q8L04_09250 [Ignavibacteria bacterium]|nr:hypothetical protein [Ignavibacteria bacterium]